ncbi:MAG: GspH/FimT family protein [Candidatus Aminicenantes bacterium]|nr:GspH/FimT family protein [Candidatus Aminicenantes bacterium]
MKNKGFTFIEIIVILGIIGIIIAASYPSILNVLETRALDSSARELLTTLEAARYMAVNEKVNCRVRFFQENNEWRYLVEIEEAPNTWTIVPKFLKKSLPQKFNPQVQLPAATQSIIFSPLGMVSNYDFTSTQNFRIILQSAKLKSLAQDDQRIITIYAGGSIGYKKAKS